jgi:hypothetical protein
MSDQEEHILLYQLLKHPGKIRKYGCDLYQIYGKMVNFDQSSLLQGPITSFEVQLERGVRHLARECHIPHC